MSDLYPYTKARFMPENLADDVAEMARALKNVIFDALAFRGLSGAILAGTLAVRLKKPLIGVRKGESTHSMELVEYYGGWICPRYVIVDDFPFTGQTIKIIVKMIQEKMPKAKCVGLVFADEHRWKRFGTLEEMKEKPQFCEVKGL